MVIINLKEKLTEETVSDPSIDIDKVVLLLCKYDINERKFYKKLFFVVVLTFFILFSILFLIIKYDSTRDPATPKTVTLAIIIITMVIMIVGSIVMFYKASKSVREVQDSPYATNNISVLQNRLEKLKKDKDFRKKLLTEVKNDIDQARQKILDKYEISEEEISRFEENELS